MEMCLKKKWVDLKFGLHHFRFMQIPFNFQYACCSFNGLMLLLLLLLVGWWKETIVQSGILLVSAYGKLLPPSREWDRAELKNCTQKFMSYLVNTWKKIAYFAAVSSPDTHPPSFPEPFVRPSVRPWWWFWVFAFFRISRKARESCWCAEVKYCSSRKSLYICIFAVNTNSSSWYCPGATILRRNSMCSHPVWSE